MENLLRIRSPDTMAFRIRPFPILRETERVVNRIEIGIEITVGGTQFFVNRFKFEMVFRIRFSYIYWFLWGI